MRGQARPTGHDPLGRDLTIAGDPILSAPLSLLLALAIPLILVVQGLLLPIPDSRADEVPRPVGSLVTISADTSAAADRDSLLREIELNTRLIHQLRDSLTIDSEFGLSKAQRERFENSIDDISEVIENISVELSRLELEVQDNTISLTDERGDGIIIRIPENLDETLSEGFQAVTEMVLEGLPDTLSADGGPGGWSWSRFGAPEPRKPRRVIEGNVVRVGDDLYIGADEDVRGSVVVVMGDAEIEGRVEGNVVVVMGNLRVDEGAEVSESIVTVGGRLDRAQGADVGEEFVFDLFGGPRGMRTLLTERGGGTFLACQALFVLMLAVALLATIGAPEEKFRRVTGHLKANPSAAGGLGLLVAVIVHVAAVVLAAVLVLTVVGLPLALLLAVGMVVAGIVATAVSAAVVGERICARRGGCPSRVLAVAVGLLALHAPSFLGSLLGLVAGLGGIAAALSVAGMIVKLAAYVFGIGALTATRFGTQTPRSSPAELVDAVE